MNQARVESLQGGVRLADWGVIRAQGADTAAFLHGQLTQDVQHLEPGRARLAGYCSAKGRLLASLVVWRAGPDEILLACSADLLPAVLKRLSMFVLRAKCTLSDASADMLVYGFAGAAATGWLGTDAPSTPWAVAATAAGWAVRLPDAASLPRYLLVAPAGAMRPAAPTLDDGAWSWLEVASGVPRIVAATVEKFVPQMVNLELVGGVSFQKGCYPGQEVVARSQYRGTVKRRAFVFAADGPAQPGQEVFDASDSEQPAGMVVNAASFDGRHLALVETKLAALDAGPLRLASPDGAALTRLAVQPYDVPVDVAE